MSKSYFIITTQRSGHHAFINSILTSNNDPCFFINNPGGTNKAYPERYINNKINYRFQFNSNAKQLLKEYGVNDFSEVRNGIFSIKKAVSKKIFKSLFRDTPKSKLIINHEGGYLRLPKIKSYNSKVHDLIGAKKTYEISFFRDTMNLLASLLNRSCFYQKKSGILSSIYDTNNSYQQERMEKLKSKLSQYFDYFEKKIDDPLSIDYLSWMNNEKFRTNLHNELKLFVSRPSNQSTLHGGGSSFKDSAGKETNFTSRFEIFIGSEPFEEIVKYFEQQIIFYYSHIGTGNIPTSHHILKHL